MFVNRLTFKEIDNVLEKIFPIVFKDKDVIEKIMETKTVAIIRDKVEISFKIFGELYSCELADFNIDFSFNVPRKDDANLEYRIFMAKHFIGKDKNEGKLNQYLTRLDMYEKSKWEESLATLVERVGVEIEKDKINQL